MTATAITAAFGPLVAVLSSLGIAIVAGYGGYLVINENVTPGTVVAFLTYVAFFFNRFKPFRSFSPRHNQQLLPQSAPSR